MANDFCPTCYKAYMEGIAKMAGSNKNVFVDFSKMVFQCRIPRFTHDAYGNHIAVFRDCEKKKDIVMTIAEYRKKSASGEI